MEIPSQAGLRAALDTLEHELKRGAGAPAAELAALSPSVIHCMRVSGQAQPLRRLATLLDLAGDLKAAIALLRTAMETLPGDIQTTLMLSDALAAENDFAAALQVLSAGLAQQPPNLRCVRKAVRLYQRLNRYDDALKLARDLVDCDPAQVGLFITVLVAAGHRQEALCRAREVLATQPEDVLLIHVCYKALLKFDAEETELARARAWLLVRAEASGNGHLWRAQLLERDHDPEAVDAEIEAGLAASPENPALLRKRAEHVLDRGYWGRDARLLTEARSVAPAFSPLSEGIANAESLLRSYGGSLDAAAREAEKFAEITSPECVFARVARDTPPPDRPESRSGLVMIGGSLGGYGAERILASTFRLFAAQQRFEWTKFYIADFGKATSEEFYGPLLDIPDSEVVLLNGACRSVPPLAWIRGNQALPATRILQQLKRDRPAVVHASLEPLNVFAGLAAALAGVPRIVLHTHNMRPTALHIRNASRLKGCYQALLARPEVVLAGCAQACIDDYVDWLELGSAAKTRVVYNGYEFDDIISADAGRRAALRAEYGIAPDTVVIGTAIRLTEVKQPLLWVDAAAGILEQRPDCRFVMFGDGDLRLEVEERIRAKGLLPYFTLPGRATDLYRRLALLDLFMLSSRTEGLPNALIEAQAAGAPVVAFDVGGVAETMLPGETGLLVKEQSARALAATVLHAIADRKWQLRAAALGPDYVRKTFSLEKMFVTLSSIFCEGR